MVIAAEYERLLAANQHDSYLPSATTNSLTSRTSFSQGGRGWWATYGNCRKISRYAGQEFHFM